MSPKKKRTFEEMVALAYDLQNVIIALCGKRPLRITTNKDFKLLRVVWAQSYEKKDWYDGVAMGILLDAFMDKNDIHVREISKDKDKDSAVWLTKSETDPEKRKIHRIRR